MRALAKAAVLGAAMLAGCSIELPRLIEGSGVQKSELRNVGAFGAVAVEGGLDVRITLGSGRLVTVEGDDNLLQHVETVLAGDELQIRARGVRLEPAPRIDVRLPTLRACRLTGSGQVALVGLTGEALELELVGSGELRAGGAVERLSARLAGSGDMHLGGLIARVVELELQGSGEVEVYATRKLDIDLTGSGRVQHRGGAQDGRRSVTGSGRIKRVD